MKTKDKIGVICGSFDLIHAGYIRMFADAKSNACTKLIVALQTDPTVDRPEKNACIQPIDQRIEIIRSIRYVDETISFSSKSDLESLIKSIKPDILVVGSDWEGKYVVGSQYAKELKFFDRIGEYSTTKILQNANLR